MADRKTNQLDKELGLDIYYSKSRFTNTFNTHRLTKFAKHISSKITHQLSMKLYKAYFCDGFELADFEILTSLAVSVGLDDGQIKELLKDDKFANEVRADLSKIAMFGMCAVPFFIIGKLPFQGRKAKMILLKLYKNLR